jgi:hypothetical protein
MSQDKWWNGFSLTKSKLANHYQQVLGNPSSKVWYNPLLLNSSNLDVEGLMLQENGLDCSWNNTCVGFTIWQPLLQANFHQMNLLKVPPWLTWLFVWWRHITFCQHLLWIAIRLKSILCLMVVKKLGSENVRFKG